MGPTESLGTRLAKLRTGRTQALGGWGPPSLGTRLAKLRTGRTQTKHNWFPKLTQ